MRTLVVFNRMPSYSVIALVLMLLLASPALAEPRCKTDQASGLICKGDKAWIGGVLLSIQTLNRIREHTTTIENHLSAYKALSDDYVKQVQAYQDQRDAFHLLILKSQELADDYRTQRDNSLLELERLDKRFQSIHDENSDLNARLDNAYEPSTVAWIIGGTCVGSLLIGAGLVALTN